MKSINLTSLIGTTGGIVLIFVCFWLYTEWDLHRVPESLPKPPSPQATNSLASPTEPAVRLHEATETTEAVSTMPSLPDTALKKPESIDTEQNSDTFAVEDAPADTADSDAFLDMFLEEITADTVTSGDFTDAEEAPYDIKIVKAGFEDYNAYLQSDPEYAYQRLDDAFREQYGDDSDVDILVEMIRHGNEGSMPIDKAIEGVDAMIRLVSKMSLPEVVEGLQVFREMLMEGKQMETLEEGLEVEYRGTYRIGE